MKSKFIVALACGLLGAVSAVLNPAHAAPPAAATAAQGDFPTRTAVGGQALALNGTGSRYKAIFRVYDAGLYTPSPVHSMDEFFALKGPRRLHLVARRDIPSDELARMLVKGITESNSKEEVMRQIGGIAKVGEMFSSRPLIRNGDTFGFDFVPGNGTQLFVNARPVGEPIQDAEFFTVVMRLWLGPVPVDARLKAALLGQQSINVTMAEMR